MMNISKAELSDYKQIIDLIDNHFSREGFGFVNRAQVETEINKGRVVVAKDIDVVIGCRIGLDTLWNIVVHPDYRGQDIGTLLVNHHKPRTIRVKALPVGHLSKAQKENFKDPTPFYEKLGYVFWGWSKGKNFWQRTKDKAQFHKEGKLAHIKVYKQKGSTLFE